MTLIKLNSLQSELSQTLSAPPAVNSAGATVPSLAGRRTLPASNVYVLGYSTAGYALSSGTHFRATLCFSYPATASTTTVTVRYGAAGTVADATIHTATYTGTANADAARLVFDVHVDAVSSSAGTVTVVSTLMRNSSGGVTGFHNAAGTPVAVSQSSTLNTVSPAYLGVAVQGTSAATVLLNGTIERAVR